MTNTQAWSVPCPVSSEQGLGTAQKHGKKTVFGPSKGCHPPRGSDLLSSSSLAQLPFHDKQHLMDLVQRLAEMEEKAQLYQQRESALEEKLRAMEATEQATPSLSVAEVEKAQVEIKQLRRKLQHANEIARKYKAKASAVATEKQDLTAVIKELQGSRLDIAALHQGLGRIEGIFHREGSMARSKWTEPSVLLTSQPATPRSHGPPLDVPQGRHTSALLASPSSHSTATLHDRILHDGLPLMSHDHTSQMQNQNHSAPHQLPNRMRSRTSPAHPRKSGSHATSIADKGDSSGGSAHTKHHSRTAHPKISIPDSIAGSPTRHPLPSERLDLTDSRTAVTAPFFPVDAPPLALQSSSPPFPSRHVTSHPPSSASRPLSTHHLSKEPPRHATFDPTERQHVKHALRVIQGSQRSEGVSIASMPTFASDAPSSFSHREFKNFVARQLHQPSYHENSSTEKPIDDALSNVQRDDDNVSFFSDTTHRYDVDEAKELWSIVSSMAL